MSCNAPLRSTMRLQCGYCTPGFLMLAVSYLEKMEKNSEAGRGGDTRARCLESLPVHRIPEHRAGDLRGRRAAPMTMIGKSVQRLEDEPLITGRGKFVANLSFPDELHMRVVQVALRARDAARRRRAGCVGTSRAWPSSGPSPTSRRSRRSSFAPPRCRGSSRIARPSSRRIGYGTSASPSPWCSRIAAISPRTRPTSSPSTQRSCPP